MIIVCSGLTKPTCPTKGSRNKSVNLIFNFKGMIFLGKQLELAILCVVGMFSSLNHDKTTVKTKPK